MPLPVKSWDDFLRVTDRAEIGAYWIDELGKDSAMLTVSTNKFFCKIVATSEDLPRYLKVLEERDYVETGPDVPMSKIFSKE